MSAEQTKTLLEQRADGALEKLCLLYMYLGLATVKMTVDLSYSRYFDSSGKTQIQPITLMMAPFNLDVPVGHDSQQAQC